MGLVATEETLTGPQVCQQAGVSYRQLDHWCRRGWLGEASRGWGSGSIRRFGAAEVVLCRVLAALPFTRNNEPDRGARMTLDTAEPCNLITSVGPVASWWRARAGW